MSQPISVLILPEVRAALEAEVTRSGVGGDLAGGLLFGFPLDEQRRLVVGYARLKPDVGFGQRDFALDQSRTSEQLAQAQSVSPQAHYCGVWYIHPTPEGELTDREWIQAQAVLEDPDYRFQDVTCLVLSLYSGKLTFHAFTLDVYQVARGLPPAPAQLFTAAAAEARPAEERRAAPAARPTAWYKVPEVARRLEDEHELLSARYYVEATLDAEGCVVFRLRPKSGYGKLMFDLVCGPGFPEKGPSAFLPIGERRHPIVSPTIGEWTADHRLTDVADEMASWLTWSLDDYVAAAQEALERGDYREANDWLTVVLSLNPRKPGAARLLAKAQAGLNRE
ncbi:MAG: hypothetical protein N2508_03640 [Anaerolineae bacterium]|nr:hypothetical protein [Anaerolineae bacterium]